MTPRDEIDRRLEALRAALAADGLDGALIVQHTDLAYFSGTNQQAHLVVPVAGDAVLLVRRVLERARAESPLERIEPLRSLAALAAALASVGLESGARIGLELDVLPARLYLGYGRRLPDIELGDCSPAVRRVRARKSDWELARMRAAAEQVRRGAEAVPALIRPGIPESQVQLEVERVLRMAGHQGQLRFRGFNQEMHYGQVLAGPSGAVPGYSDSPLCGPGPN
ncbi:MAG: aminopeptidase P family N-terminal domain-containing protein, partial [Gaiellales bacterium]